MTKNFLIPKLTCMASEFGKIVANKCLDKNISLNTLKLEKLLILMQVECIRKTKKALFKETIIVPNQYNSKIKEVDEDFLPYAAGMNMIPNDTRFCYYTMFLMKQEEVVDSIIDRYGNLDSWELEKTEDIQLMHKISEELNTQNIQPPLIFYGLSRFPTTYVEENNSQIIFEKKQVKILEKIKKLIRK